jgi:hypothetical protein
LAPRFLIFDRDVKYGLEVPAFIHRNDVARIRQYSSARRTPVLRPWILQPDSDLCPEQESTGSRGYFGNVGSLSESRQSRNWEPFAEAITRA